MQTNFVEKCIMAGAFLAILCFCVVSAATMDKSGVKPEVLSLPSGPGSIEGLGESFEPQLNTGTATYRVPLAVSPGRAGFGPNLALAYNSGHGNGIFGLGWRLDFPSIQRQTDKGQPRYTQWPATDGAASKQNGSGDEQEASDTFLYNNDELLLTADGWRCKNESEFVYVRFDSDFWTATRRDGVRLQFGSTPASRVQLDDNTVFAWYLDTLIDTNGNTIFLVYEKLDESSQVYCASIQYNIAGANAMELLFSYEPRPDIITDFRPGFELRTGFRCNAIEQRVNRVRVRSYRLEYAAINEGQPISMLAKITHVGQDSVSELPPAAFTYTAFAGDIAQPVEMSLAPVISLADNAVDLMDINADGLPDILDTGQFPYYCSLNLGKNEQGMVAWTAMTLMDNTPPVKLSSATARLADVNGNGKAELLDLFSTVVRYYSVDESLFWRYQGDILDAPFSFSDPSIRLVDCNNDNLIDVMQTAGTELFVWINLEGGRWSKRYTTDIPDTQLQFDRDTTKLADMNGDRILDLVFLENNTCYYYPAMGYGRYGDKVAYDNAPEDVTDSSRLFLADVNGDGLADAVYVGDTLRVWINLGIDPDNPARARFTDPMVFRSPLLNAFSAFRQADMNGNGSTDIVWNTPDGALAYLDFIGSEKPYQLKTITNGIGLTTTLGYSSSVDEMVRAREAGDPWTQWPPFPVPVVTRIESFDGVNPPYISEITYRDGYYDGLEREFRGFAAATRHEYGDGSLPDLFTDHIFDTGIEHEVLKGKTLAFEARAAEKSGDRVFYREDLSWEARKLLDGAPGEMRAVFFAAQTARQRTVTEQERGTPATLRWEYDYDVYGNRVYLHEYGRLDGDWGDERITETTYSAGWPEGRNAWILDRVVTREITDGSGRRVAREEHYYDGLGLGAISRGNLTMTRNWVTGGHYQTSVRNDYDAYGNIIAIYDGLYDQEPGHYRELVYDDVFHTFPVMEIIHTGNSASPLVMTATYDYGFGVMTSSTEFNGFTTTYGYDTFGRLTSITKPPDTEHTVEYDYVLAHELGNGQIINWVETRQRNPQSTIHNPKSAIHNPQSAIRNPKSEIRNPQFLRSRTFYDGLGRTVMTRTDGEDPGQVVVSDTVIFNARKLPWKNYLPYFETGTLDYVDPSYHTGCTVHYYDALGREIRMDQPDGSWSETLYAPLERTVHDEEQTNPASPHYGCGMRYVEDGLQDKDGKGRLREVYEIVKLTPTGEPGPLTEWRTQYRYNLLDNLTGYTDSLGNQKFIEYDGLGRKTFMNDPDRGHMRYEYDVAGNLIRTTDAKGQVIRYAYDGVNRLLAEYYGADTAAPDVEYHYDTPAGPVALGEFWTPSPERAIRQAILEESDTVADALDLNRDGKVDVADVVMAAQTAKTAEQPTQRATNTRGYLAWVRDLSGEEHNSYDARGRVAWTIKRIQDAGPDDLRNFYTGYEYDAMDRVTTLTYPDQTTVHYSYNARGLLETIPNVVTQVDYNPAGQTARLDYACGTSTTYDYDIRLRLSRLRTVRTRDSINLQDLNYTYDSVSNITAITDGRSGRDYQTIGDELGISLEESKKFDNTQSFQYDSLYRLIQSANPTVYGTITHRYDPIGNMKRQDANLLEPDPLMNLGVMTSGGTGGTSGRIGRSPADPPGPHAITSTEKGPNGAMAFAYDANGNMIHDGEMEMRWDYKDRLKGITKGETVADYLYDYKDTRKKKGIQGEGDKTVFYVDKNAEVRSGKLHKYVYVGSNRVGKMDSAFSLAPPAFYLYDHLGSTNYSTNMESTVGKQLVNYPYGHLREKIMVNNHNIAYYRFTGKEHDYESGLHYFEARYQLPIVGRFSNIDPLVQTIPENWLTSPQKHNLYQYVSNSPVTRLDLNGTYDEKIVNAGLQTARSSAVIAAFSVVAIATLNPVGVFVGGMGLAGSIVSGSVGLISAGFGAISEPGTYNPAPIKDIGRISQLNGAAGVVAGGIAGSQGANRQTQEFVRDTTEGMLNILGGASSVVSFYKSGKSAYEAINALGGVRDIQQGVELLGNTQYYSTTPASSGTGNNTSSMSFEGATIYGDPSGGGRGYAVLNDTAEIVK